MTARMAKLAQEMKFNPVMVATVRNGGDQKFSNNSPYPTSSLLYFRLCPICRGAGLGSSVTRSTARLGLGSGSAGFAGEKQASLFVYPTWIRRSQIVSQKHPASDSAWLKCGCCASRIDHGAGGIIRRGGDLGTIEKDVWPIQLSWTAIVGLIPINRFPACGSKAVIM